MPNSIIFADFGYKFSIFGIDNCYTTLSTGPIELMPMTNAAKQQKSDSKNYKINADQTNQS